MSSCKYWCFTGFIEGGSIGSIVSRLEKEGWYHMGEEICPTTERPHLQGFIELRKKGRANEMFSDLKFHWEPTKGSLHQNMKYTGKDGKVHTNREDIVDDPLEGCEYYEWEKELLEILDGKPDRRTIHWRWSEKGDVGKSSFLFHCKLKYGDKQMKIDGAAKDIANRVIQAKIKPRIIVVNIPKCQDVEHVSYAAIEMVKDGYISCGKYEGGEVLMNPPHIIVMANYPPNEYKMSADRWDVKEIG